ncbi:transcriptional regulator [Burkholderia cepacia]|nr:transcriptional regulator [Burkholderia cepacia]
MGSMVGLAGCSMNLPPDFSSHPLVAEARRVGATRESVLAVDGAVLRARPTRTVAGSCVDYQIEHDQQRRPFYVAFDRQDQVISHGFLTCNEAEVAGYVRTGRPAQVAD